jgi:intracellular sulfur oxidation DsrE/DsrF family protein
MQRRSLFAAITGFALLPFAGKVPAAAATAASSAEHKVAFHIDVNDPAVMNMVLNNVSNLASYYAEKGGTVAVEVVAYGPGLHMLRDDTSPVKDRIQAMAANMPKLAFSACGNTRAGMAKNESKVIPLLAQAKEVPAGVVRLVELQEAGWSYIRP